MVYGDYHDDHPLSEVVDAVAKGEVDVAAVWGPVAGYFARKEKPPLVVTPIVGNPEARLPMTFDIAMGVRRTDKELKAQVDSALSSVAPQIRTILASYGVPIAWRRRPIGSRALLGAIPTLGAINRCSWASLRRAETVVTGRTPWPGFPALTAFPRSPGSASKCDHEWRQ